MNSVSEVHSDKQGAGMPSVHIEEATDRWFSFVEDYYKDNTIPLSQVLCPNAYGYRGVDATWNLTKRELIKCRILDGYKDEPSAGPWDKV